jgi:ABC-type phosphate/phosphonate transport system substrate-binding protein
VATPIAYRKDLPEELKDKIKKAYINLPIKEPDLWEKFRRKIYNYYPPEIREKLIYIPSDDSMYNGIRKIARECKDFNFLNPKKKLE